MRNFLKLFFVSVLVVAVVFSFGFSKSSKSSKYAWLGVVGQTVDTELAEAFDLPVEYGAIVNDVLSDSPAEKIGLEEEDIIIEFAGARVYGWDDLTDIIDDHNPGDEVKLKVNRDGKELELKAVLEGRPKRSHSRTYWFSDDDSYVLRAPKAPRAPRAPRIPSIPKIDKFYFSGDFDGSYIGVHLSPLSRQLGEYFGVERGRGVLITEVEEDSPAEEGGLKAGDVIVAVDGDKVLDYEDVSEAVDEKDEGEVLSVTVMRDKSEKSFDVRVAEREDSRHRSGHWYAQPDIDIRIPDMRGLHYGLYSNDFFEHYDSEEFEEEMRELMEEIEELDEELRELKREHKEEWKEELEELRKELEELRERLD